MTWQRMVLEIGMGTDIRGNDPTKAAVRALRDALWRNSLGLPRALGLDADAMRVQVRIGVPRPRSVDTAKVLEVLPHGTGTVEVVAGGLLVASEDGSDCTLVAHAAAVVWLDVPDSPRQAAR